MSCTTIKYSPTHGVKKCRKESGQKERWEFIRELSEGGQGRVSLVRETDKIATNKKLAEKLRARIVRVQSVSTERQLQEESESFFQLIRKSIDPENPDSCGALKELQPPEDAHNAVNACERMEREINAIKSVNHPNLIQILDSNIAEN